MTELRNTGKSALPTRRWEALYSLVGAALAVLGGTFFLVGAGDKSGLYFALSLACLALVIALILLFVEAWRDAR